MEQWTTDFFVGRRAWFTRGSRNHDRRSLLRLHGRRWLELWRRNRQL